MLHVGKIAPGLAAEDGHPGLNGGVMPKQVECHAPQQTQVAEHVAGPHPALVFPKDRVQDPVKAILDAQVRLHSG